jgi:hypothetical protein
MRTLEEARAGAKTHKGNVRKQVYLNIACPKCGEELVDVTPGSVNASYPPTVWGVCPCCANREVCPYESERYR